MKMLQTLNGDPDLDQNAGWNRGPFVTIGVKRNPLHTYHPREDGMGDLERLQTLHCFLELRVACLLCFQAPALYLCREFQCFGRVFPVREYMEQLRIAWSKVSSVRLCSVCYTALRNFADVAGFPVNYHFASVFHCRLSLSSFHVFPDKIDEREGKVEKYDDRQQKGGKDQFQLVP